MTRNPLLLTHLCLLHRDRGGLPRRRGEHYETCIDLLLERWRGAVGLSSRVSAQDGRRVLQAAALWLHEEKGRTRATAEELAPVLEPVLDAIRWEGDGAWEFLAAIRDDSGLLVGWDNRYFGFMHLGFQEYLAAREIRRLHFAGNHGVLIRLAERHGESWWREVALLLVGLGDPSVFAEFMRVVARTGAFVDDEAYLDALVEDAAEISLDPLLEVIEADQMADPEPPGGWLRTLVALRMLDRLDPELTDRHAAAVREP